MGLLLSLDVFAQKSIEIREQQQSSFAKAADGTPQKIDESVVARYGKIISKQSVGAGGLTAWIVEKNGNQVVLYTTPDAGAVFTGIVWDAASGKNLSDQFIPQQVNQPPKATYGGHSRFSVPSQPVQVAQYQNAIEKAPYTGTFPESIKTVSELAGYKEGSLDIASTVYVIIDPRCSICRNAYRSTRKLISAGYSIKWIPTSALGDPVSGDPLAAVVLRGTKAEISDLLTNHNAPKKSLLDAETKAALDRNLQFFKAAFNNNPTAGQAGVPVAFFFDRRSQQARMLTGFGDNAILEEIFGAVVYE
jgi:hypothetical protein